MPTLSWLKEIMDAKYVAHCLAWSKHLIIKTNKPSLTVFTYSEMWLTLPLALIEYERNLTLLYLEIKSRLTKWSHTIWNHQWTILTVLSLYLYITDKKYMLIMQIWEWKKPVWAWGYWGFLPSPSSPIYINVYFDSPSLNYNSMRVRIFVAFFHHCILSTKNNAWHLVAVQ